MLGRENVSNPLIALGEIVKNAYDADASLVTVHFILTETGQKQLIIEDNGCGMDLDDLRTRWLIVGTNSKERDPISRGKRVKVGKKGIGRLSLDRLADNATLETCKEGESYGLRLFIDWTKYDDPNSNFSEIRHPLEATLALRKGTRLILGDLHDEWTKDLYSKLRDDLSLLIPPFDQNLRDFNINLLFDDSPEQSGPMESQFAALAEYELSSTLSIDGVINHVLTHRDGSTITETKSWSEAFSDVGPDVVPKCGPLQFHLYFYLRDPGSYKGLDVKVGDVRKLLDSFQGVRIYRDYFRVKPYGEPDNSQDWLGLNWRRVKSPEEVTGTLGSWRLAENQVIGAVHISRTSNQELDDKTNREGLIENEAFYDLRKFLLHGIGFLELSRQIRESSRKTLEKTKDVKEKLDKNSKELNQKADQSKKRRRYSEEKALRKAAKTIDETKELIEGYQTENQLLMGLATLGIAMASFGHETSESINNIRNRTELMRANQKYIPEEQKALFNEDLEAISESIDVIKTWGTFALDHIRRDKRTKAATEIGKLIEDTDANFEGPFDKMGIKLKENISKTAPQLKLFPMDIEAILINFSTNAIEALKFQPLDKRFIEVEYNFDRLTNVHTLIYRDSGRGIPETDVVKIFNPMYSTKTDRYGRPVGTGLGLTIVKRIVEDYNGTIVVLPKCDLGGAEFTITIPHNG